MKQQASSLANDVVATWKQWRYASNAQRKPTQVPRRKGAAHGFAMTEWAETQWAETQWPDTVLPGENRR